MLRTLWVRATHLLILLLVVPHLSLGQNRDSAAVHYVAEVLTILQQRAMHRDKVDWPTLSRSLRSRAQQVRTIPETYPLVVEAIQHLNDQHSYFVPPRGAAWSSQLSASRVAAENAAIGANPVTTKNIGYVKVRAFAGTQQQAVQYVAHLREQIAQQDTPALRGWIIDLRNNSGGNLWPMLTGLGPVLGEGVAGYFTDVEGTFTPWGYQQGRCFSGTRQLPDWAPAYQCHQSNPVVAVLTNSRTASSGEAVAVAFRGRPRTRTFGIPTRGLTTANQTFRLSDGALLFLTTGPYADRTRQVYPESLMPDELMDEEQAVQQATQWIRGRT